MVRTGEDGPKGISCLVIEKDMKGVSFGAQEKKLGWHSQPTAQVNFDEVRVPVANRVGARGRRLPHRHDGPRRRAASTSARAASAAPSAASTRRSAYTKDRKQFGKAIADFQNTQFMLADMETDLQAARYLLYVAAAKVTANAPDKSKFAAMAKRLATDNGSVDRRPRAPAPRRLRLSPGLSDRALLARPARPFDPRGHQPGHADDHQPRPDPPVMLCLRSRQPSAELSRSPGAMSRRTGDRGTREAHPAVRSVRDGEERRRFRDEPRDAPAGPDAGADGGRQGMGRLLGRGSDRARPARRRATGASWPATWQDDAYYRSVRDAYLLASKQLREMVGARPGRRAERRRPRGCCSTNI